MVVKFVESCKLPTQWGDFEMHGFKDDETGKEHIALTMGDLSTNEPVLTRVHSECLTGDALFSLRCDCGPQLRYGLEAIAKEGRGVLLYLKQEGRGIGLLNKVKAYKLQDAGADTVEANEHLGFEADLREYSAAAKILRVLSVNQVRLLTNNPGKVEGLEENGVQVTQRIPLELGVGPVNINYLKTKKTKFGHTFETI